MHRLRGSASGSALCAKKRSSRISGETGNRRAERDAPRANRTYAAEPGTAQLTRDKTHHPSHRPPSHAHTSVNSNPAQRVRRSRDGSRLANPHRQANLRRRGELHRDGDALHHKRHVFARRPRGLRLVLAVRQLVGTRLSRALEQLEQRRADRARRFDEHFAHRVTEPLGPGVIARDRAHLAGSGGRTAARDFSAATIVAS